MAADGTVVIDVQFPGNKSQFVSDADQVKSILKSIGDGAGEKASSEFQENVDKLPHEASEAKNKANDELGKIRKTAKTKLEADDSQGKRTVNEFKSDVNKIKDSQTTTLKAKDEASGSLNKVKHGLNGVNQEGEQSNHIFRHFALGTAIGQLAANAFQNIASQLGNVVKQGLALNAGAESINAQFKAMGYNVRQIKSLDSQIGYLKTRINATGGDIANIQRSMLNWSTSGVNGAQRMTTALAGMAAASHKGGEAVQDVSRLLMRAGSSGKVSIGILNRISRIMPNFWETLSKGAGMSQQKLKETIATGKVTTEQFQKWLMASDKYAGGAFKDLSHTQQGAVAQMKGSWSVLEQEMTKPLFDMQTQALQKMASLMRSTAVQGGARMLGEALAQIAQYGMEILSYMGKHREDISAISTDLVKIAGSIVIDVWKTFAGILGTIGRALGIIHTEGQKSGGALHTVRQVLDGIAKNKTAIKVIADSLIAIAGIHTFNKVTHGLASITGLIGKSTKGISALRAGFKGLDGVKDLKGPEKAFAKLGSSAKGIFANISSRFHGTTGDMAEDAAKAGPGIGSKLAHGLELGFMALNIVMPMFNAIRDRGQKRASDIGQSLGATTGAVAGGAIAAALGMDPMLGAALGSAIGRPIGSAAGKTFSTGFNREAAKGVKSASHTMAKSADDDLSIALNKQKSAWQRFKASIGAVMKGEAINEMPGTGREGRGSSSRSSSSRSRITRHTVESLGGNHYSKADIESVKKMNAAIKDYTRSLQRLKDVTKKSDPTSALKHMNKELGGAVSNWRKLAKPIRAVGNAFKTLQKFASAMTKRKTDPFQQFSKDLPKLDKALSKYSKRIKAHLQELAKALSGGGKSKKSKGIASAIKALDRPIRGLERDLRKLDKPLGRVTKDFKSLSKTFKEFSGKKNPLSRMATGFKDLAKDLDKSYKTIDKDFEHLAKAIKSSKIVTRLKQLNKPLTDITGDIKTLDKHLTEVDKSLAAVNKDLTRTQKLAGARSGFNRLSTAVKGLYNTIRRYPFGGELQHQAGLANRAMTQISRSWLEFWRDINSDSESGQEKLESSWSSTTKKLLSTEGSFTKTFLSRWSKYISQVDSKFKKGMSLLPEYAASAMRSVVRNLNRGISAVNNTISAFGGRSGAIRYARYANGTGYNPITVPTLAVLNDGSDSPETGNKEAIYDRNTGAFGIVQGTNTPALLAPGQEVIKASDTRNLMNFMGFQHFAGGTGWLSSLMSWSKGSDNSLRKFFDLANKIIGHPSSYLNDIFSLGSISPSRGAMNTLGRLAYSKGKQQGNSFWSALWSMANDSLNGGAEGGLLGAVEKYGKGHPYVWGAAGPSAFDCSGLVMYALNKAFGRSFPHYSGAQYNATVAVSDPQPGDLVFFGPGGSEHVGVYAGNGNYWSAMSPADGIGMSKVSSGPGHASFRRVPGLKGESASTGPKATKGLESFVKRAVGPGFWKFIGKLSDLFGINADADPGGMGVQRWGEVIKRVAAQMHTSVSGSDIAKILDMIRHESGGDPSRTQPGADPDGDGSGPARGLLQFKTRTFDYYRMHKGDSVYNGTDALRALFNDSNWRSDIHWGGGWAPSGRRRFANGGIANEPSIFGEAGPEMAIPLSVNKASRTYELIGKTAAMAAARDNLTGQVQDNSELVKQMKNLVQQDQLLQQIIAGENEVKLNINMDGRKVGQMSAKYVSRMMAHKMNGRRLKFSD